MKTTKYEHLNVLILPGNKRALEALAYYGHTTLSDLVNEGIAHVIKTKGKEQEFNERNNI